MMEKKILVGTSKGLVVLQEQGAQWEIEETLFLGLPVSMLFVDRRNGNWWVGLSHRHWGEKLHCSKDQGKTWEEKKKPSLQGEEYYPGQKAKLKKIWVMQQASPDQGEGLWLGTEPGALFYSEDGEKFDLVRSLWDHPSRQNENQWFGAGRDFPFIHSIVVDPENSEHVYIAISSAGVFETIDKGQSWHPKNNGLRAAYLPNPEVEVGHDPHLLLACKKNPSVLWQQNHSGIFRTEDGGSNWKDITAKNSVPDYGFALAIDHENPDRAFVIPAQSDEVRVAADLQLRVFETNDKGHSWESKSEGLPKKHVFDIVLRQAFLRVGKMMVFGTNNGNLYWSADDGENWKCLSSNLAKITTIATNYNH